MRVLLVLTKRTTGGTANLAAQWAEALREAGVTVAILSITGSGPATSDAPPLGSMQSSGYDVPGLGHRGRRDVARTLRRLRTTVRTFRPDVIHVFFPLAETYASLASLGLGVPVWGTIVSTGTATRGAAMTTFRRVLRHITPLRGWIAVGHTVRSESVTAGFPSKAVVTVYPGIDVEGIKKRAQPIPRTAIDVAIDARVLITVGRLVESKGHRDMLCALKQLGQRYVLLIVGSGPMEKELREFAEQLGITKRVRFLGTRHDVPNLLATADVYVTATRYEGLAGYALLEAALAGCRIVASDIPEIREVFDDMPGEFVTVGAPSEIVEGVKRAIAPGITQTLSSRITYRGCLIGTPSGVRSPKPTDFAHDAAHRWGRSVGDPRQGL